MIAGKSLIGILIVGLVSMKTPLPELKLLGQTGALVLFLLLAVWVGWVATRG
ncbi:hypothetical protein [Effusibacillus pohliae]|uniref:hypothetical protein n=1 Tax=Effusibacillus pohliae TaxID=232270 RepID=UPI00036CDFB3|nr:hypothetical protein [Effusibacillus pohliae]